MKHLRQLTRYLPLLLTALLLSVLVWMAAVTATDPNQVLRYTHPINVNVLGVDPNLILTGNAEHQVIITIKAPSSVHTYLANNPKLISAMVNLSGLGAGEHSIAPTVQVDAKPVQVVSISPETIHFTLEQLVTNKMAIELRQTGNLPIGYQTGDPTLSITDVEVVGPKSQVERVKNVVALVDLSGANTSVSRVVTLNALDSRGNTVGLVNINPSQVQVSIPIKQLGDYRNVFVRIVTTGQIARGFYLTGLVADPPNITIYGTNPEITRNMPDYIETVPININGAEKSFEVEAQFNLPQGIDIVGDQKVKVHVGIEASYGSILLAGVDVTPINLAQGLKYTLQPPKVDIYISGPLNLLYQISSGSVRVTVDAAGKLEGKYQVEPVIIFDSEEIRLDSITPGTLELSLYR